MSSDDDTRVIGYFAFIPPLDVICDGDACVIAGSEDALRRYIGAQRGSYTLARIRKTRFGEILEGMRRGGAYAFDEESYDRFHPLAAKAGLRLEPQDFSAQGPTGIHLVRVAFASST